mmetsp:Transcript_98988/g.284477  ORF Transcript_98988/g.284477 Transcript_98988/m.284477 type:complete len:496 (-) Transcript_98988:191-1678(-)
MAGPAPDFGAWIADLENQLKSKGDADKLVPDLAQAFSAALSSLVTGPHQEVVSSRTAARASSASLIRADALVGASLKREAVEENMEVVPPLLKVGKTAAPSSIGKIGVVSDAASPQAVLATSASSSAGPVAVGLVKACTPAPMAPLPAGKVSPPASHVSVAQPGPASPQATPSSPSFAALRAAEPKAAAGSSIAQVGGGDPVAAAVAMASAALAAAGVDTASSSSSSGVELAGDEETKTTQWAQVFAAFQDAGHGGRAKEYAAVLGRLGKRIRELLKVCQEASSGEDILFQGAYREALEQDTSLAEAVRASEHAPSDEEAKTEQWGKIFASLTGSANTQKAQEYHQALAKLLGDTQKLLRMYQVATSAEWQLFQAAYQEASKVHKEKEKAAALPSEANLKLAFAYQDAIELQMQAHRAVVSIAGKTQAQLDFAKLRKNGDSWVNPGDLAKILQAKVAGEIACDLPRKPGLPTCQYYMRTGECAYSFTCKFDHPPR